MIKIFFITSFMLLVQEIAFSQTPPITFEKVLSKQQAIDDYSVLYTALINYHPNPFLYVSESDLEDYYETQKSTIPDSLNELDFHYLSRQLIAQIKCGHTFAKPSKEWYTSMNGKNILLPFEVKMVENRLFFSKTTKDDFPFKIYDELLSINNVKSIDILQQMSIMQERDGITESYINALIEKRFRLYYLFLIGIQSEFLIEYKTNSGEIKKTIVHPTNQKMLEITQTEMPFNFKKIIENDWSVFSFDSSINVAYLKINNFNNRTEYKKYYQSVFKFLNLQENTKLIIDLRDNPGGYFGNGNNFLTFLTPNKFELNFKKPKKIETENKHIELSRWVKWTKLAFNIKPSKHHAKELRVETFTYKPSNFLFKGEINVITNGLTFSQAALVAAHLREYGAVFYGQETGGTEIGCNGLLDYTLLLPNSSLVISIPMYQVNSNLIKATIGYGVKPDFPIEPTLDNSRDKILFETINILMNSN